MRVDDLPRLGMIYNPADGRFFGEWSSLDDKNLLCLGLSENQIDDFIAIHNPQSVTVLTYWADHIDAHGVKYDTVMGDITTRTDFEDGQFDAVLSLSVLEHVSDVAGALHEMNRITKPGGEMLHLFGPAWSCPYGHHLYASPDDANLNFVLWDMPAHMHLLCDEQEVCDYYQSLGYGVETGQFVYNQFHVADHINRVFYDDYVKSFHHYQVERLETMFNPLPLEHDVKLRNKFPGRRDFSTYGGRYKILASKMM